MCRPESRKKEETRSDIKERRLRKVRRVRLTRVSDKGTTGELLVMLRLFPALALASLQVEREKAG